VSERRPEWLAIVGAPLIGLGLLWLLRWFLPSGMALAIALTSGIAWGYCWKTGRLDMVALPVTLVFALAVAAPFPDPWRFPIAVVFVVAGSLVGMWIRHRLTHAPE
jgi:hypothetical protein